MSQFNQPDKKIVSKGKYVQVQSARLGIGLAGFCLLLAAAFCGMLAIFMFLAVIGSLGVSLGDKRWDSWGVVLLSIGGLALMVAGTRIMCKMGLSALDKTDTMNNVVPLTKATLSDVSAHDSLVRASEEPPVAAETILLRAAADNPTTPPEQLVRPSTTLEQNTPETV